METTVFGLYRVRDVNWADPDINRAGIVPIFYDGKSGWLGLGVSQFATTITAIGGAREKEDHDLLSTAVREYNEEVGTNLPHITEESVVNCYAIKTAYTIQVLLPVAGRLKDFVPTPELYTMIWVTPTQLSAMANNPDYALRGGGQSSKAYSLAGQLKNMIPSLTAAVTSGTPFRLIQDDTALIRPVRVSKISEAKLITDIKTLEQDANVLGDFRGHLVGARGTNYIALMRLDRTVYLLPMKDLPKVIEVLNVLGFRTIFLTDTDMTFWIKNGFNKRISGSIEDAFNQLIDKEVEEATALKDEFVLSLQKLWLGTEKEVILTELDLIWEYEEKTYELVEKSNTYFNSRRACFLKTLHLINFHLSKRSLRFPNLNALIGDACEDYNGFQIINTLVQTGVLIQDRSTTIISIPR